MDAKGAGAGLPYLVNADGAVVVGGAAVRTPSSQDGRAEPYMWKKGAGAVALALPQGCLDVPVVVAPDRVACPS